jgi:hypothetical protein
VSTAFPLDLQPRWRLPSDLGYGPDNPPDRYVLGDVWITRHRDGCFHGKMFHVNARNKHLVYRIGNYRPRSRTWEAAWPD